MNHQIWDAVCLRCHTWFDISRPYRFTGVLISAIGGISMVITAAIAFLWSGNPLHEHGVTVAWLLFICGLVALLGGLLLLAQRGRFCPGCGSGDVIGSATPKAMEISANQKQSAKELRSG